jgi:hypothetical protein
MILGTLLLLWGIGIVGLAFYLQTKIQEGDEPQWQRGRELYNAAPITFCITMAIALSLWPGILIYTIITKGTPHGN